MNKNRIVLIVLIVIAILLLLGIGLLVAQQVMNKNNNLEVSPTPIISTGPTIITNTPLNNTAVPTLTTSAKPNAELTKKYSVEILPNVYSFNYYSNWNKQNEINYNNTLSIGFGAGPNFGCISGEVICSLVFNIGTPAVMLGQNVSTKLGAENVIIDKLGTTELSTWKYNSNGKHFLYLAFDNGYFLVNLDSDKDQEAIILFKEILKTFSYNKSPNAN